MGCSECQDPVALLGKGTFRNGGGMGDGLWKQIRKRPQLFNLRRQKLRKDKLDVLKTTQSSTNKRRSWLSVRDGLGILPAVPPTPLQLRNSPQVKKVCLLFHKHGLPSPVAMFTPSLMSFPPHRCPCSLQLSLNLTVYTKDMLYGLQELGGFTQQKS